MAEQTTAKLQGVAPLFFVRDVKVAGEHYVTALGFAIEQYWGDPPCFAMPQRDGLIVMLKEAEDRALIRSNNPQPQPCGGPWDAYFWVNDARLFFDEVKPRGAAIAYGPVLQTEYNNWEFAVRDADGYLLAFGSDAG